MKIGCGLFGLGKEMQKDFTGTMVRLKEYGFSAVEPILCLGDMSKAKFPHQMPIWVRDMLWDCKKIKEIQPILIANGLEISSAHVNFIFGKTPVESVSDLLKFSEETGIRHYITSMNFSDCEHAEFAADQLSKANQLLNLNGVTLSYHNHETECQTIQTSQGVMTAMDYFMKQSDRCVTIQLDAGWMMYGNEDVINFIELYKERIISIHLKDFKEGYEYLGRDEGFVPVGQGVLPTDDILKNISQIKMMEYGLMIDQDMAEKGTNILDNLKTGIDYVKKRSVRND